VRWGHPLADGGGLDGVAAGGAAGWCGGGVFGAGAVARVVGGDGDHRPRLSASRASARSALRGGGRMIINRFAAGCGLHGELCPILGAKWERRFAVSCGQMRPGAVIVAVPSASDVLEHH
jgi:hypothetical protein